MTDSCFFFLFQDYALIWVEGAMQYGNFDIGLAPFPMI